MADDDGVLLWSHADAWADLTDQARAATVPWTFTTEHLDRYVIDVTAGTVTHLAADGTPAPDRPFDPP